MKSLFKTNFKQFYQIFNRLSSCGPKDVEMFEKILDKNRVKREDLDFYNTDWLRTHSGLYPIVISMLSINLSNV